MDYENILPKNNENILKQMRSTYMKSIIVGVLFSARKTLNLLNLMNNNLFKS